MGVWRCQMVRFDRIYPYDDMFRYLQELSERFASFTILRMIGESHDERLIPMLRIGTGTKVLLCTAGIHGRESLNPTVLLRMMEDYCTAYEKKETVGGYDAYTLLNRFSICFIPLVNPDGYEIAVNGFSAVRNPLLRRLCKMRRIPSREWRGNARGIDINRNFPCRSYTQQQLSEYPASEQETLSLMRVMSDYDTVGYLDFHSRGELLYYYRHAMTDTYNERCRGLAEYLAGLSGYRLGLPEEEFPAKGTGGSSVNFYSKHMQQPAVTVETVPEDCGFPLPVEHCERVYEQIFRVPIGTLACCAAAEKNIRKVRGRRIIFC